MSRFTGFCIITVALAAAYSNSFKNQFQFDDFNTIVENPAVRSLANLPRILTDARAYSVIPANQVWRPLTTASFALDYWIGGGYKPFWFHVSTFAWLVLTVFLVWRLFARFISPAAALFGALLFGVHPAIAETVNYISQRSDLISTCLVVAALLSYRLRGFPWHLILFTLAILFKQTAVVFPVLLFIYLIILVFPIHEALKRCIAWVMVASGLTALNRSTTPGTYAPGAPSAWHYWITQPYVALRYFGNFFRPHLSADTDLQPFASIFDPLCLIGLTFVLLTCAIVWFFYRARQWPAAFGLAWFLIAMSLTSLIPLAEVENDHRMLFPFVGLALAIAGLVNYLIDSGRMPPWLTGALVVWVLAVGIVATRARNEVWRTPESLWRNVTEQSPHNGRGWMNYGVALMGRGAFFEADRAYDRALDYLPRYSYLAINRAINYAAMRRPEEADTWFQDAIALAPADAVAYFYYGRWLASVGRMKEAGTELSTARSLNPAFVDGQR